MIGILWDWSKITCITIMAMGLAVKGYLTLVSTAMLIALYVMLRGIVRGSGGITKTLFWFFEISFILLLCVSILAKGGGEKDLIPLIIGLSSETVGWVVRLVIEGDIGIYHGLFFIVAVIILRSIGIHIGNTKVHLAARTAFLIGVPIAMFIMFAGLYGEGNILGLLSQFVVLLLVLVGFYIMAFGWSSSRQKG
ncbi:hypothetical protein M1N60_01140 [Thermodesulfovibrionales bacterium]|nr:hypothetical protein [Thermodesulfovibrionales bacterium]